ncbi:MAG TPA: 4-alpha-glucanotransferase [Spirochaetota bacterium]|nr:4-alpha-glucanotransferase [Spirochaetota bacterium]
MQKTERNTGLLLHITSLGGDYGIGSLGKNARLFIDYLNQTGVKYWQILPFNPVVRNFGYSPYASTSTFAGNPLFIDCADVIDMFDFLSVDMLPPVMEPSDFISFETVDDEHNRFFSRVYHAFSQKASLQHKDEFNLFCESNSTWLDDYGLFTVLSDIYQTNSWINWPEKYARRDLGSITKAFEEFKDGINQVKFIQYVFFKQWENFRKHCKEKSVQIIGDIPIYVSYDSSDAWANPELFLLNSKGIPDPVAGVPPDYFSKTGQRWGNPIYRWFKDDKPNHEVFEWWHLRVKHLLKITDLIRIDHFRAFESYWAIPEKEETAVIGSWEKGPGRLLFDYLKEKMGNLPFIAEDLGIITKEVVALREELGFPGMKVLQFAFDQNPDNDYLPHSLQDTNTVLYTGTHDNNTSNGWFYGEDINKETREYIIEYLGMDSDSCFHKKLIKTALRSTAETVIIPVQDLLGFSSEFRMNTPGTMKHSNWRWQLKDINRIYEESWFLKRCNAIYNRLKPVDHKSKEPS